MVVVAQAAHQLGVMAAAVQVCLVVDQAEQVAQRVLAAAAVAQELQVALNQAVLVVLVEHTVAVVVAVKVAHVTLVVAKLVARVESVQSVLFGLVTQLAHSHQLVQETHNA